MSVSAIVIGCSDRSAVLGSIEALMEQTVRPDEVISITCCMEPVKADKNLSVAHQDLWGQEKCDYGVRLSDCDRLFFYSSDDSYEPTFIEKCLEEDSDLVLVGFSSHLVGEVTKPQPVVGSTSRGAYMVKTGTARRVGYTGRSYGADGEFVQRLVESGASVATINEILHYHN